MKKLFTLIAMCLLGVGAMQADEKTVDLSSSSDCTWTFSSTTASFTSGTITNSTKEEYTATCITKSSYTAISKISLKISCTNRDKETITIDVCPNADFSSNVTNIATSTYVDKILKLGNISISANKSAVTGDIDVSGQPSGYIRIKSVQKTPGSGTTAAEVSLSDVKITTIDPYTVTFNAGVDGTCETASLTETSVGVGVTLPSVTANSGYTFSGWATTDGATTADAGAAEATYNPSADCTLYAVYTSPATWEIDFAKWATDNVTQGKDPAPTYKKIKEYTVDNKSTYFYALVPPTGDNVKEGAPTTVFDTKFLAARNSSFLERFRSSTELGLFVNASAGTTTTYVVRELKVGDILYIAADTAATFITPKNVEEIPYSCGDKVEFTYSSSSASLPFIVYQYKVTTAGDQLFKIPNRKYIYKVGVESILKDNSTKEQFAAGGNGYSTFSAQSNFKVTGADVYYAPNTPESTSVTMTKVADDAIIPANQGVILKAAAAGDNITVNLTTSAATDELTGNNLKAVKSGDTSYAAGTNYVLMTNDTGTETKFFNANNSSDILKQLVGKCYLNVPTTPSAKSSFDIIWGDEETTAISNVNANTSTGSAQASATRKAMVNGKLVVITANGTYNVAGARIK